MTPARLKHPVLSESKFDRASEQEDYEIHNVKLQCHLPCKFTNCNHLDPITESSAGAFIIERCNHQVNDVSVC